MRDPFITIKNAETHKIARVRASQILALAVAEASLPRAPKTAVRIPNGETLTVTGSPYEIEAAIVHAEANLPADAITPAAFLDQLVALANEALDRATLGGAVEGEHRETHIDPAAFGAAIRERMAQASVVFAIEVAMAAERPVTVAMRTPRITARHPCEECGEEARFIVPYSAGGPFLYCSESCCPTHRRGVLESIAAGACEMCDGVGHDEHGDECKRCGGAR